jgi:hypothetical protein
VAKREADPGRHQFLDLRGGVAFQPKPGWEHHAPSSSTCWKRRGQEWRPDYLRMAISGKSPQKKRGGSPSKLPGSESSLTGIEGKRFRQAASLKRRCQAINAPLPALRTGRGLQDAQQGGKRPACFSWESLEERQEGSGTLPSGRETSSQAQGRGKKRPSKAAPGRSSSKFDLLTVVEPDLAGARWPKKAS